MWHGGAHGANGPLGLKGGAHGGLLGGTYLNSHWLLKQFEFIVFGSAKNALSGTVPFPFLCVLKLICLKV